MLKGQHLKQSAPEIPDEAIAAPVVVRVNGVDHRAIQIIYERGDKTLAPESAQQGHDLIVIIAE